MSAEVVMFPGVPVPAAVVEDDAQRIVRALEEALGEARTGRFYGIGIVLVAADGDCEIDTRRVWDTTVKGPPTRLVAGLHMLVSDIAAGRS